MNEHTPASATPPSGRRPGRPTGRRSGDRTTRDRILTAARQQFAQGSYAGTTIRAVAAEAQVNPALVIHYFGSKRDLFAETLRLPLHLRDQVAALVRADPETAGEHVVRLFLGTWNNPTTRAPLAAMMRSVFSDEEAAEALGQFLSVHMIGPVVAASGRDRPDLRVTLIAGHLVGLAIGRHVLGVTPLASAALEDLIACVAPVVQHYLTGDLPSPAPGRRSR
ncbi:TetR family transcriptional regulator [Streptomyces sp. ICBB 8177]|uniref:TetR/AcrR family transcriptional regulator n=1 Tax=Streptomyces sp. ICBB 8177 TaxID=563922 RepID=UPI000D675546|nr:TetR family transcriptional regulator [Streptomyces sp. ICBB 8177]PWI45037.1 TetR family transcriptional regulator [Streptomyces sp. ICBB 8177]